MVVMILAVSTDYIQLAGRSTTGRLNAAAGLVVVIIKKYHQRVNSQR